MFLVRVCVDMYVLKEEAQENMNRFKIISIIYIHILIEPIYISNM
jgi:hypothetical protein